MFVPEGSLKSKWAIKPEIPAAPSECMDVTSSSFERTLFQIFTWSICPLNGSAPSGRAPMEKPALVSEFALEKVSIRAPLR
jgi:hypothetical protein